MIEITHCPGILKVTGHAGAGPAGQDVVCAGVSALVCTLGENLRRRGGTVQLERGLAVLRCPDAEEVFEAFGVGLRLLADRYPQWIQISWKGNWPRGTGGPKKFRRVSSWKKNC